MDQLSRNDCLNLIKDLCDRSSVNQEAVDAFVRRTIVERNPKGFAKKQKEHKAFDMSKYRQRHLAFHVQYDGSPFYGFAEQNSPGGDVSVEDTVEKHIFDTLKKLRLIEHRRSCNYSRCGRTDRGVSAFGQVVAARVRSAIPLSVPDADVPREPWAAVVDPATGKSHIEMNYIRVLNHSLPDTIRVLGWCEVTPDFSARFSCGTRTYRYFFQRRRLDVAAMNDAAGRLVGEHDFRNLAKLDVANVSNFVRVIQYAKVVPFLGSGRRGDEQAPATATTEGEGGGDLFMLEIRGVAFLWHQVRNIMAVLTMVGEGKEDPAVVDALFDVSSCPACPDYMMADERPLVLHHCEFAHLNFRYQATALWDLCTHFGNLYRDRCVQAAQAQNALQAIADFRVDSGDVGALLDYLVTRRAGRDGGRKKRKAAAVDQPLMGADSGLLWWKWLAQNAAVHCGDGTSTSGGDEVLQWGTALKLLSGFSPPTGGHGFRPTDDDVAGGHASLMQRARRESYDSRVAQLAGKRKERYDSHMMMVEGQGRGAEAPCQQGSEMESSLHFFKRMRAQGNLQ